MSGISASREACSGSGSAGYYERHRPDQTLLYQIIEQHDLVFSAPLVDEVLPHQPMRQWVLSVLFAIRFLFAADR